MTIGEYFKHYISFPQVLIFFAIAFGLIALINLVLYAFSKPGADEYAGRKIRDEYLYAREADSLKKEYISNRFQNLTQKFYALIFSVTSMLFFITVYYLIYRFYDGPLTPFLEKYDMYMLLLLIVVSCLLNAFFDRCLIRLTHVGSDELSPIKILGMVYMMLIFAYIKFIYENDNYDMYITYFLGLMIGRFVYFDASFKDFIDKFGKALANIPILILGLACTGAMALYGFGTKFLIKHIGVVTNVCIAHLFLCIAIVIIYHIHPERWIMKKGN